jgi:hypothetical protein
MPKLDKLSPDKRQQLKEYFDSLKEIHREISEILSEVNISLRETSSGGNNSKDLTLKTERRNKKA